ncbi:hypothetical protein ACQ858_05910 [Variovorax ureilyticus]|uniref:hypothetical protein n=1 Tax=Variovorax ureilyticus TaxID=1836198 RepID=UPI003D671767
MNKHVLLVSLVAVAALTACGKKEEPAPAAVAPAAAPAPAPAPAPASPSSDATTTTPSPNAQSAPDAANAATDAEKKQAETPPAKP